MKTLVCALIPKEFNWVSNWKDKRHIGYRWGPKPSEKIKDKYSHSIWIFQIEKEWAIKDLLLTSLISSMVYLLEILPKCWFINKIHILEKKVTTIQKPRICFFKFSIMVASNFGIKKPLPFWTLRTTFWEHFQCVIFGRMRSK